MRTRWGFAVMLAGVAIAIAVLPVVGLGKSLSGVRGRMAVGFAQSRFLSLHGTSRSLAVELGVPVSFVADLSAQTVTLREGCDGVGRVLELRDFNLSYRVQMLSDSGFVRLCMTPRGYADPRSNSFEERGVVTFLRGSQEASVVLFPLGHAVRS